MLSDVQRMPDHLRFSQRGQLSVQGAVGGILAMVFTACVNTTKPVFERLASASRESAAQTSYKVSVRSAGREVKNFSEPLVHRLLLQPDDVDVLQRAYTRGGLVLKPEHDSRGGIMGLRVVRGSKDVLEPLGLKQGDLLSAFGKQPATSTNRFRGLLHHLAAASSGSMTLIRNGSPHKIFYTVSPPSGAPSQTSRRK